MISIAYRVDRPIPTVRPRRLTTLASARDSSSDRVAAGTALSAVVKSDARKRTVARTNDPVANTKEGRESKM